MSMTTSPHSNSPRPRRRKHKDEACEPCRKAKTRCDHTIPICLRCQRKGAIVNCVYFPMHPPNRSNSFQFSTSDVAHRDEDATNHYIPPPQTSESISLNGAPPSRKVVGFFGPTSFSVSFLENDKDFVSDVDDQGESILSSVSIHALPTLPVIATGQQAAQISSGIKILSQLPDQATCELLISRYTVKYIEYAFHKPTMLYCMQSFWTTFGESLRHPRNLKS